MKISAILLAGGQSKRMGKDKAFLRLGKKAFIRIIAEKLSTYCNQIVVSGNKEGELYLSHLKEIDAEISFIKDKNPYAGPLNGIISCREYIKHELVFIATCDTPFLNQELIPFFYRKINSYDAVIPVVSGKLQFLNTLYTQKSIEIGESIYEKNVRSLYKWVENLNIKKIEEREIKKIDKDALTYWSINTPEDYERIKYLWRKKGG
ncbi:molybdenum cofactor guanylyltransferase [Persephonella hydrogeniphila]|uniref:Probable molybdenum cofactor guanylyltransferase n=2 Tax=Persephonella hydrogeniphila TaxID=198703 RepID=A0A285NCU4_9AQUI|nr:molybdenum cofactor guanylyltransferase [Persephonella hydrogeniphila]